MIVGIAGLAGSGKSLCAEYLRDCHGFRIVSFADPIKAIVQRLWGFTNEQLYGPSSARSEPHPTVRMPDGSPLTARVALQVLGTDVARQLDRDVWVRAALAGIGDGEDVVVPDMRFPENELPALRARGAFLIRRKPRVMPHPNEWALMHDTERAMSLVPDSEFDAVLGYEPSKLRLYQTLDVLVMGWRARTEVA